MKSAGAALMTMLLSVGALAAPFELSAITVNGLQRVSLGSVLQALPIQEGDRVDTDNAADWLRAINDTGYFNDARVSREGDELIFDVTERPAIHRVEFSGNKSIPTDSLERVMENVGLDEGEIYSQSLLEGIELELERQYSLQGRYNASVDLVVTPLSLNRVDIELDISEGPVAKVDHIEITGNRIFTDAELLDALQMRETSSTRYPFQFIARRNRFGQAQLTGDESRLENYYLDRGYLDFRLESTQVSIADNKSAITLVYNVHEGEPYTLSNVELTGDLVGLDDELNALVTAEPGDTYSRLTIANISSNITNELGERGYAFADVRPQLEPDADTLTVSVTLQVNPGQPVYVNRIEIRGNTATNDEVIRRELRQLERGLVINRNIRQSRARLERLGYFSSVNINTRRVSGRDDLVDLVVEVEETTNSQITGSIGFSDASGIFAEARVDQKNFQGKGYDFSASVTVNESQQSYNLSFNDPYFTINGVSRGIDLFYRRTDFSSTTFDTYATNTFGGRLTLGYPIAENQRVNYALGYSQDELFVSDSAPQELTDFKDNNPGTYDIVDARVSWVYNSLNGTFKATRGRQMTVATEVATPLGDLTYYRLTAGAEQYFPINDQYSIRLHTDLGYGGGYGESSQLPFYKNFYSGGVRSIRGYQPNSLGPLGTPQTVDDDADPIGGNIKVEYGAELLVPMPLVEDQSTFRTSLFIDGGNVFTDNCRAGNSGCDEGVDIREMRYAAGIDVTWITPLAPLSLSYAWPLNAQDGDQEKSFAFTIGLSY
ncbi:outer membrane protein assembly factor BamA [Saccharospirillum sp. MSK14-1]|uniref:outer membrane protein assembly factor BamA n=1 Tax=Saccharospirillum sp. MSK14-1 TaxID=1897632 RepID=UPI000D4AFA28|nr:outer membrane protein assembly factor BamA [Saccharospirillum sp. MSK14-1]PTY37179.1 outer membrane protein assembly factor BamA [Saccharospirillum sp. MSK14-1]